jgi:hypothetical protein
MAISRPPGFPLSLLGHCLNRHFPAVPLPWSIGLGTVGQVSIAVVGAGTRMPTKAPGINCRGFLPCNSTLHRRHARYIDATLLSQYGTLGWAVSSTAQVEVELIL